jgi:hypothetical protein
VVTRRVSILFYLGSILGAPIFGVIGVSFLMFAIDPRMAKRQEPPVGWVLLVGFFILYASIMYMVLLYKAWAAIQDGQARTTPGKAVGFCFIPFFNFYWIFQAFYGFAVDFNRYAARHSLSARVPEGLFLAYPILLLVSSIPLINILSLLPMLVMLVIVVVKMCEAINAVADGPKTIPQSVPT